MRDFPGLHDRARAHHDARSRGVRRARRRANVAATITPQHLLYSRNALFAGGIRPHLYCLPVLKREAHRQALVAAATSGNPKFFLGTDSAPHARHAKETACGCAGCYSAPIALPLYAEAFEDAGALDRLEGFASHFGADFYGLPRNADTVTLVREPWTVPAEYPFGDETRRAAARRRDDALARGASTSNAIADDGAILAVRSQPDRRCPSGANRRGEESPGSAEQDAG